MRQVIAFAKATVMGGVAVILLRRRVRPVEGGMAAAVKVVRQFGLGTIELSRQALPPSPADPGELGGDGR